MQFHQWEADGPISSSGSKIEAASMFGTSFGSISAGLAREPVRIDQDQLLSLPSSRETTPLNYGLRQASAPSCIRAHQGIAPGDSSPPWTLDPLMYKDLHLAALDTPEYTPVHPQMMSSEYLKEPAKVDSLPWHVGGRLRFKAELGDIVPPPPKRSFSAELDGGSGIIFPPPGIDDVPYPLDSDDAGSFHHMPPPSIGSIGHPVSCSRGCKYAWKPKGCKDGANCMRCHLCPWRRAMEREPAD